MREGGILSGAYYEWKDFSQFAENLIYSVHHWMRWGLVVDLLRHLWSLKKSWRRTYSIKGFIYLTYVKRCRCLGMHACDCVERQAAWQPAVFVCCVRQRLAEDRIMVKDRSPAGAKTLFKDSNCVSITTLSSYRSGCFCLKLNNYSTTNVKSQYSLVPFLKQQP